MLKWKRRVREAEGVQVERRVRESEGVQVEKRVRGRGCSSGKEDERG